MYSASCWEVGVAREHSVLELIIFSEASESLQCPVLVLCMHVSNFRVSPSDSRSGEKGREGAAEAEGGGGGSE